MRIGFNGATTMTSDLATDIRVAAAAGFDVLEITATKLDHFLEKQTLADARRLLDASRLKTYALNSIEKINSGDPVTQVQVLARTRQLVEYARALDCPWIVSVPGPVPEGTQWPAILDLTVASLRAMNEIAAPQGVHLAFEFLGFPWCSIQTAAQAWEIVQATGMPDIGMVIDTCHFYAGDSTLESIERIDPKRLAIFHVNDVEAMPKAKITDANRLFPGDGVIPLKSILAAVRGIGYDGVASVEIFRPEYWERDPLAVAKEALTKTRRFLAS